MGCAIHSTSSAGQTLLQDPVPLTEYYSKTLKDYKGMAWNEITPSNAAPMLRVKNMQDAEFKDLVRRGYPFIVDDCIPKTAELTNVPCSEFGRRYPNEHMKAEYTPGQSHVYLKDPDWYSEQKPTAKAHKHLSLGKPLAGPYVWHVKDETEDIQTKRDLMKLLPVPYFLNSSALNSHEARDSFEFWFALENGGTQAHADAYCETTLSVQLRGRKTWRLGAFPNITNAFQPYAFHDGEIYKRDEFWRPEYEEDVEAGQCVVFPQGYIHETYVKDGASQPDGCSVASTFQFQDPQPVHMWKNFLTRWGLSHYTREEPCTERMEPYVFLGAAARPFLMASASKEGDEAVRAHCGKVFQALDTDKDARLALSELAVVFAKDRFRPPWTEVRDRATLDAVAREKVQWQAEDTLLYHDDDQDGLVSIGEFEESALKYLAVRKRAQAIQKTRKRAALLKKEKEWIRNHLCTSDDCSHLRELQEEYDRGRKRGSGQPHAQQSSEL